MIALLLLLVQQPASTSQEPEFSVESRSFGMTVSAAGDQDGDGAPDFVVGEELGMSLDCWVVSGKNGRTLRQFRCTSFDGWHKVLRVPDLDGDHRPEFAICGIPREEQGPAELLLVSSASGRELWRRTLPLGARQRGVQVVRDADGDGLEDIGVLQHMGDPAKLSLTVFGSKSGALVRSLDLEAVGTTGHCDFRECPDLDGDGKIDLLSLEEGVPGRPCTLRAWSEDGVRRRWEVRDPRGFSLSRAALALLGDVDGDRIGDVAAGFDDRVCVVSGKSGKILYQLDGVIYDDSSPEFGAQLLSLGDVDGDGASDLLVAEPQAGLSGNLRAFSGRSRGELWAISPPPELDVCWFGWSLDLVGDVDGDGVGDVIAGSWEGSAGYPGFALLISGRRGTPLLEFRRGKQGVVARTPDPGKSWVPVR